MGVCAGLGRYTGIDPVVFRVGVAVLLLGSGVGLFLYLAAFLLMKEPNGRPGLIEQWTRRDFDAEAVMALLSAVLAFGLALNLATVWLDTGTLVVGLMLAMALLAAHARGVDLLALVRSLPERLNRRPPQDDLGRHTGIDPVVFRVGFAVLMLGSGIGLFLYIAGFLLMKEPNGKPGLIEQWTRRDFDADTVLALMTAVLALGLGLNVSTVWLGTGTLVVGLMLAMALLAAHARGVDLLALVRSLPERLNRRPPPDDLGRQSMSSVPMAWPAPPYPFPEPPTAHPASAPQAPAAAEEPVRRAVPEQRESPTAETAHFPTASAQPSSEKASSEEAAPEEAASMEAPPKDAAPERTPADGAEDRPYRPLADNDEVRPYRPLADDDEDRPYRPLADEGVRAYGEPYDRPEPYRRPEPRTAAHAAYGEPFAPRGPYQPLDPARRAGYSPYDPALYGRPPRLPRERRPRSFIGAITILLAIIIGGIVVAVQAASPSGVHPTIVAGAMLVTIGGGLVVAAWWGRGAGLVAAGTVVAMLIGVGLMFGGLPSKVGASVWHPTEVAEAGMLYDAGVGDGRLDLSELRLKPGSRVTFNASVSVGQLTVIVPPTARVEVYATNKLGDIQVDQSLRGGVDVRFDKVLTPEVKPKDEAATIVLNLRGGVGDLEVRRGA